MCDPALVFRPELMQPINATHPEHHSRQPECARVIEDVLISGAFRTAVWTVEIQPLIFADSAGANLVVDWFVALRVETKIYVFQAAVDFVSRRKDDRRRVAQLAHRFE